MGVRIKAATPDLSALRAQRVDWPAKIHDLKFHLTAQAIAETCGCTRTTVFNWSASRSVPHHREGETILALHRKLCGER